MKLIRQRKTVLPGFTYIFNIKTKTQNNREESKWRSNFGGRCWAHLSPWTHQKYMCTHVGQFSLQTTWRLAGRLSYNQSCMERPTQNQVGWRKSNWVRTYDPSRRDRRGGGYYGLQNPPCLVRGYVPQTWGLTPESWVSGWVEFSGISHQKVVSLVGFKTRGTYWKAIWNRDSTHEEDRDMLDHSWEQHGRSILKAALGSG